LGNGKVKTSRYFSSFILRLFEEIDLVLTKPLEAMLSSLIICLLENNKAHLTTLARALPMDDANEMAHAQRIRRFLSNKGISPAKTVLPLIRLLRPILSHLSEIVLVMDQTSWEKRNKMINILSVALSYKGRAIPLFWIVRNQKGNSSFDHWKEVLTPVIEGLQQMEWLIGIPIHVVADREFASPKLAFWLFDTYHVDSTLRIKRSMYLSSDGISETKISVLLNEMASGTRYELYNQIVTRDCQFKMNVVLRWDEGYDEPLIVTTTLANPGIADTIYEKRFGIEPMHKDWKSNAFELNKTRVTDPKRIETLLIPIAFAYVICVLEGEERENNGDIRKPPKGKNRMIGLFLNGIRTIANHIKDTTVTQFKNFIRDLFKPFFNAWRIPIFS
jgi:Transposase DDE domain